MKIPFNKPLVTGEEGEYLNQAIKNGKFSGGGEFTQKCSEILEQKTGCLKAIMTPSCTAALEMASLLCNLQPGDEVIMPSYTFVTTASAFALRGVEIVWCEIRADTKNIDETRIETLITPRTKAVVVVHYAGVPCEMDTIKNICRRHNLFLVEDAAQAIGCFYKGEPLGKFGDLATLSFHETKNLQCGEGGALLVNNPEMVERAQVLRDKGTNRIHFNCGIVDKYTWVDVGSSFLMSELQAAFLYPQFLKLEEINRNRLDTYRLYYHLLADQLPPARLPMIPPGITHNGHMFYFLTESQQQRKNLIKFLDKNGIMVVFHYIPLHRAPFWAGKYDDISLPVTDQVSNTLLRLPLYYGMEQGEVEYIAIKINHFYQAAV
ncbi:MAG TPA: dTDP-4-amino-4,6-dideoxygalactose transaminase [Candidatus Kapabacteria bacterium]|nr:dTDP-4-amino-4,6-dideoxygalactose transaminase [Candidatus Kapabacteria bacterium]